MPWVFACPELLLPRHRLLYDNSAPLLPCTWGVQRNRVGTNSAELPCANYEFLKQLRAAPNAADKKAMVMQRLKDRQARMKDKASAATNRAAYLKMYKAYCENGHSTEAICTRYIKKTGTGAGLKA